MILDGDSLATMLERSAAAYDREAMVGRLRERDSYRSIAAGLRELAHRARVQLPSSPSVAPSPRPSWDDYFLEIAAVVARRSTCLRVPAGVGAVLVRDRQILATGYCGSIRGTGHCTEAGCLIDEKTGGCVRTVHAEVNALLQAAEHGVGVRNGALYSTMSPCWDCFKALANAGVSRIVYTVEYRTVERQREHAALAGIDFVHVGTEKYAGAPLTEGSK